MIRGSASENEARHRGPFAPHDASMDDALHALYIRAKFEHGEREIRAGRGVSHAAAKRRIRRWVR